MPAYANSSDKSHFVCPNCGADVPPKALACPECGADENAGWNDIGYVGGGLSDPEDVFGQEDYRAAFDREFGEVVKPDGIKPIWWITGIVLLAIFLYGALRSFL